MADVFTTRKRSEIMSRVRSRGNKATELRLIQIFKNNSVTGWRRRVPLFGNPDFVFREERLAVFVDGCFWHSCPKHRTQPVNNPEFWEGKLQRNVERDRLVNKTLKDQGWRVLRVWQHELLRRNEVRLLSRIERAGLNRSNSGRSRNPSG
jgi:DNA mismatch endonuclease, patch repair protein